MSLVHVMDEVSDLSKAFTESGITMGAYGVQWYGDSQLRAG